MNANVILWFAIIYIWVGVSAIVIDDDLYGIDRYAVPKVYRFKQNKSKSQRGRAKRVRYIGSLTALAPSTQPIRSSETFSITASSTPTEAATLMLRRAARERMIRTVHAASSSPNTHASYSSDRSSPTATIELEGSSDHSTLASTSSRKPPRPTKAARSIDVETLPANPSYEMFCQAIDAYNFTNAGGHPPVPGRDVYYLYQDVVARHMSLQEQAMLLANVVWESAGLQYSEEIACRTGNCPYGEYYGRGFIQLTWDYNYRAASLALYGDERYIEYPELVADVEDSWKTTYWYWRTHVTPRLLENRALENFYLGYSVMAINGRQECTKNPQSNAWERLRIYNAILRSWNISDESPGTLKGCCIEPVKSKRRAVNPPANITDQRANSSFVSIQEEMERLANNTERFPGLLKLISTTIANNNGVKHSEDFHASDIE